MFRRTRRSYNLKKRGRPFRSNRRNRYGKYTKRNVASRNKIHYFKRKSLAAILTGTLVTGADQFGSCVYTLSAVQNPSEFTALFDRYKIKSVRTDFVWLRRTDQAGTYGPTNPTVYTLIDYNDSTVPTSTNQMLEYGRCRTKALNFSRNVCSVYFKPKLMMYAGAATSTLGINSVNPPFEFWLSTVSTGTEHYGLKYGISGLWTQDIIEVYHTYYLAFKDSK